jgi:hypothetical protein
MPLEIKVDIVQPNTTRTFTFSDTIAQPLVGISGYQLSFGETTDHHLQTLCISLATNKSGSVLQVTPNAILRDGSGNNLDPSNSWIAIIAMAWVGSAEPDLEFACANNIADGYNSSDIAIPCTNPSTLQAVLTGFNLSFGSGDHHFQSYLCAAGSLRNGGNAAISGSAALLDGSGNIAPTATINGGLIANCDASLDLQFYYVESLQDTTAMCAFTKRVTAFQPFLTSVQAAFSGSDHHLKTLSAYLKISGQEGLNVTVTGGAYVTDNSGNHQNDSLSRVSGFVIGY